MDRIELIALNGSSFINGFTLMVTFENYVLTNDVHNSSEGFGTDGNHNWVTSVFDFLSSNKTIGGVQGDSSDSGISQMLGNFKNKSVLSSFDFKGVENGRKVIFELDIDDGTDDLGNLTSLAGGSFSFGGFSLSSFTSGGSLGSLSEVWKRLINMQHETYFWQRF